MKINPLTPTRIIAVIVVVAAAVVMFAVQSGLGGSNITTSTTAAATSQQIVGVAGSTNMTAIEFAVSHGVKYFREDIGLNQQQEQNIAALSGNGARFIGILDYVTLGVQTSPRGCLSNCNWTLSDWNATVANAIAGYPSVHVWEIWNEPQFGIFQSGFQNGSPYNYYLTAKSAYGLIKAHNSSDTVLCLGGDNIFLNGAASASDFQWAQQAWGYGLGSYCDAISLHAYSDFEYLLNQTPGGSAETTGQIFNRSLSEYENLTGRPIWITETGIPSNALNNTPEKQAEFLNQSFALYLSKPYVKAAIWFNLLGYEHKPYDLDFGLLNATTLVPKPSWYAFLRYVNAT